MKLIVRNDLLFSHSLETSVSMNVEPVRAIFVFLFYTFLNNSQAMHKDASPAEKLSRNDGLFRVVNFHIQFTRKLTTLRWMHQMRFFNPSNILSKKVERFSPLLWLKYTNTKNTITTNMMSLRKANAMIMSAMGMINSHKLLMA